MLVSRALWERSYGKLLNMLVVLWLSFNHESPRAWVRQPICSDRNPPAGMPRSSEAKSTSEAFLYPWPCSSETTGRTQWGKWPNGGNKGPDRGSSKVLVFLSLEVSLQNNHINVIRIRWPRERKGWIPLSQSYREEQNPFICLKISLKFFS